MKVTLINHSDLRGGASLAAVRILDALRAKGIDARMIVKRCEGDKRDEITAIGGRNDIIPFLAERLRIFVNNGFSRARLFQVSIADRGLPLHDHPWIKDADVVMLHWFNQGMMTLKEIRAIGAMNKPIVWTMHDMWPMTGICHHAKGCTKFMFRCGECPLLGRPTHPNDLSTKIFQQKATLYDTVDIQFVAVSNWVAECGRKSALLKDRKIEVVHNAFPISDYSICPTTDRSELGLPDDGSSLIVMCAARLDDPIKDMPGAIDAMNRYEGEKPVTAVFCGEIRNHELLERLRIPYVEMGKISAPKKLNDIYAHASAVISSSVFETLGGTLIEGMASGAVPVCYGGDGREEIFRHLSTGYLAEKGNVQDLANGLDWAVNSAPHREFLHEEAKRKFEASVAAEKYISIFNRLVNTK